MCATLLQALRCLLGCLQALSLVHNPSLASLPQELEQLPELKWLLIDKRWQDSVPFTLQHAEIIYDKDMSDVHMSLIGDTGT